MQLDPAYRTSQQLERSTPCGDGWAQSIAAGLFAGHWGLYRRSTLQVTQSAGQPQETLGASSPSHRPNTESSQRRSEPKRIEHWADLSREKPGPVQAERKPRRFFVIQCLLCGRVVQKFVRNRVRYCLEVDKSRVIARLARRQEQSCSVPLTCNTSRATLLPSCRASFLQIAAMRL